MKCEESSQALTILMNNSICKELNDIIIKLNKSLINTDLIKDCLEQIKDVISTISVILPPNHSIVDKKNDQNESITIENTQIIFTTEIVILLLGIIPYFPISIQHIYNISDLRELIPFDMTQIEVVLNSNSISLSIDETIENVVLLMKLFLYKPYSSVILPKVLPYVLITLIYMHHNPTPFISSENPNYILTKQMLQYFTMELTIADLFNSFIYIMPKIPSDYIWMKNSCSYYLSNLLYRNNGILTICEIILNNANNNTEKGTNLLINLISTIPSKVTAENYIKIISKQLIELFHSDIIINNIQLSYIMTNIIVKLTINYPIISYLIILSQIFSSFLYLCIQPVYGSFSYECMIFYLLNYR